MKKKLFFLPLLAALALTGCSSDEDLGNGNKEDGNGYGYVAVNIVQPKSVGTRANGSDQFQDGSTDENEAKTGLFFIFNASGSMVGNAQEISLTSTTTPGTNTPYVERIYDAVLVIDGESTEPTTTYQIVCVLNAPDGLQNNISNLEGLRAKIGNYDAHTKGKFIMTNSVYKDGGKEILGAEIKASNIAKSADAALDNPVNIYVERVVAKINAKSKRDFNNQGALPLGWSEDKKLTIKVTGIEVANIAKKSYLIKNITDVNQTWTWNDVTNMRSYWEIVPTIGTGDDKLDFDNKSYENIATDGFDITNVAFTQYVQPNTSDQETAILVTAQLFDGNQPADLAYINRSYTTKDGAKNIIANHLKVAKGWLKKKADGNGYTTLEPTDFDWKDNNDEGMNVEGLESYEVVAQLISDITIYDSEGNEVNNGVEEVNKYLAGNDETAKKYRARIFTDGKCYYFVNIEQTSVAIDNGYGATDPALYGVIRNHIYELTLNSIKGVGTPVFDPKDVIIPEKPDDEQAWFLAAQINVLKWRLATQVIDF